VQNNGSVFNIQGHTATQNGKKTEHKIFELKPPMEYQYSSSGKIVMVDEVLKK
jgi:hypothetical protein